MPKIKVNNAETGETHVIKIGYGANLRKALGYTEAEVYKGVNKFLNCRGLGLCAKCIVEVEPSDNISPRTMFEDIHKVGPDQRMSCRVKVYGDIVVKTAVQD